MIRRSRRFHFLSRWYASSNYVMRYSSTGMMRRSLRCHGGGVRYGTIIFAAAFSNRFFPRAAIAQRCLRALARFLSVHARASFRCLLAATYYVSRSWTRCIERTASVAKHLYLWQPVVPYKYYIYMYNTW